MRRFWEFLNKLDMSSALKSRLFIFSMMMVAAAIGAAVWAVSGIIFELSGYALICFMGYPCVFGGFITSVVYLYNHEFR